MTEFTKYSLFAFAILALGLSSNACSRSATTSASEPPLALQIAGSAKPVQAHLLSKQESTIIFRRGGLKMTSPQPLKAPTGVEIRTKIEGGEVKAHVAVLFNDLDDKEWWTKREEAVLGTFRVKDTEATTLSTLRGYGIEPFELRVIRSENVNIPLDRAPLRNQTRAIQVLSLALNQVLGQADFRLKNISDKNIIAYTIGVAGEGDRSSKGVSFAPDEPWYPGEEKSHLQENYPSRAFQRGPQSDYQLPTNHQQLMIFTAVFEDGTFEGDPDDAGRFLAVRAGRIRELTLALPILKGLFRVPPAELPAELERVKARLSALPTEEKRESFNLTRFPSGRTPPEWRWEQFQEGMYYGRNLLQSQIEQIEASFKDRGNVINRQPEMGHLIRECERWAR
jgi:hypothetical protein